jgi:hypothetical protein
MKHRQITTKELDRIYNTMTVQEAVAELETNLAAFYKLLDQAGIERKIAARRERVVFELVE